MDSFVIEGGRKLDGDINLQGCKNAALPILAASILSKSESIIHNVPGIEDVGIMIKLLKDLGCKVIKEGNTISVNSEDLNKTSPVSYTHLSNSAKKAKKSTKHAVKPLRKTESSCCLHAETMLCTTSKVREKTVWIRAKHYTFSRKIIWSKKYSIF